MTENKEYLIRIIHEVFSLSLSEIKSLKDYYSTFKSMDISDMKMDVISGEKDELEWALANPKYDFSSILKTQYPNEMIYKWFEIQHENILFILDNFEKGKYILTVDDIPDKS